MKRFIEAFTIAVALLAGAYAQHPPLSDFGHGSMRLGDNQPATGTLRYLIILLDDDLSGNPSGDFPANFGAAYYRNLVFNSFAPRVNPTVAGSVNGYLLENAKGRVLLAPAIGATHPNGVIGPYQPTATEANQIAADMFGDNTLPRTQTVQGRVALDVAVRNGFVLADFDTNGDGTVSDSELGIIVVKTMAVNGKTTGGENRGLNRIPPSQPGGGTTRFSGRFVGALRDVDFMTLTHEITHTFGTNDIYSIGKRRLGLDVDFNYRMSLMGSTITTPYNPQSFHLDCWHKMSLGWCEPRIVSMRAGGVFSIPAAQSGNATNPLLLYDPEKGALEYFMLEYRSALVSQTNTYDGQLGDSGVILWHVQMNPNFRTEFEKRAVSINSPWTLTQLNSNPGDPGHPVYVPANGLNAPWVEGPPFGNGEPGINTAWKSGQTKLTYVNWNDGSSTKCRFRVHPFNPGDTSVTVEILSEYDTWVDFAYVGVETGTFNTPYNTMYEGAINVGWGGNLKCKGPRSGTLSIILDKPMTITAEGGPVTISEP